MNAGSKLSNTEAKIRKMTDLQILSQIDSAEDPKGEYALRKIDFTNGGGMSFGRKEFSSKTDAFKALEDSKMRVADMMA